MIQALEGALGIQADGSVVSRSGPDWESEDERPDTAADCPSPKSPGKEKFEPFNDLYKRRFLWYYETYLNSVEEHLKRHKDGELFEKMPFETEGNTMKGHFQYSDLRKRLMRIKDMLDQETASWTEDGLKAQHRETGLSANLQRQFEQLTEHHRAKGICNLSLEMESGNPFVWLITYFGKPMTHMDGGVFRIQVSISTRFPEEQPRVRVLSPLYHHRVSKDGILCYFPKKPEEMRNHVEAIVEALEGECPPFDPRTIVHPEATQLLWGSAEEKKKYHRLLRRSAQRSVEE